MTLERSLLSLFFIFFVFPWLLLVSSKTIFTCFDSQNLCFNIYTEEKQDSTINAVKPNRLQNLIC